MNILKRYLAILLAIFMLLGCMACAKEQKNPRAWEDDDFELSEAAKLVSTGEEKYAKEDVVTISILVPEYADPEYPRSWNQRSMQMVKQIARERFGLNFVLEETIGGDSNFKAILNTKIAAGADVPDVVRYDMSVLEINQLYSAGHILDLSEYAEYMPDVMQSFEELPSLKNANCAADGAILRIPSIAYNIQHISNWGNIRRDWLDALGLESPKTTQEFHDVLKAFQDNDMNGNGKRDEVYIAGYEAMNTVLAPAFGAYGLTEATAAWYADENDNVYSAMLTNEAKNYVQYVAAMFGEGLFWSESFTDNGSLAATLINENCRAGQYGAYWDSLSDSIDAHNYGRPDEYNPVQPLTDGVHPAKIMMKNYGGSTTWMLTKGCPAPDRVCAFLNWCYSKEASSILYLGDKLVDHVGTYYREVPMIDLVSKEEAEILGLTGEEYSVELTEEGKKLDAQERNMASYLGANNGLFPMKAINTPAEIASDFYSSYDREASRSASDLKMNMEMLSFAYQDGQSFMNLPLAPMTEEQQEIFLKHADLFTYMNEMFRKFMMGVEPISNWDSFVQTCYDQGMEEVLNVIQQRYDALK